LILNICITGLLTAVTVPHDTANRCMCSSSQRYKA
jgi:hypothetical protein